MSKHIVITVFGSLGDLHPMIALSLGLQARGHRVTIATTVQYREKVETEGIGFAALGPEMDINDTRTHDELFDALRGPEILIRKYLLPCVAETARDLQALLQSADCLLNAPTVYASPVVAETMNLPWASVSLQPFVFFSADDPPLLPQLPFLEHCRSLPPGFWKGFWRWMKSTSDAWPQAVYDLRRELGVPDRGNPLFEGQFSPYLNLALFSPQIGPPQPDWPEHTATTGFLFYDRMSPQTAELPTDLQDFLASGTPPVVFTLGSSVVKTTTGFYKTSLEAAKALGCRAVFLAGEHPPPEVLPDNLFWGASASYSALFPHAAAIVHQGGIGTTAQALRAGNPMLVVPHGFDQPDNAARIKRLGVGRVLYPNQYRKARVIRELGGLLENAQYAQTAQRLGEQIRGEDGLRVACDAIEALLNGTPATH